MARFFKASVIVLTVLLFGCATAQQTKQATEGVSFKTGKERQEVIEAIVQVLTEEGFAIDNINEKYGIVNCDTNSMLTGELMKKIGEPGGSWISTNPHMIHTIEFSATVKPEGVTKLKVVAYEVKDENVMSTIMQTPNRRRSKSIDVHRTNKLSKYYVSKIKNNLGI